MMKRLSLLLIAVLLALPFATSAQESPLSEDDLALIETALETINNAQSYSSYVGMQSATTSTNLSVVLDGQALATHVASAVLTLKYTYITQPDSVGNLSGTANEMGTRLIDGEESSYILEAELRIVDDTVYINAAYLLPDPALPL